MKVLLKVLSARHSFDLPGRNFSFHRLVLVVHAFATYKPLRGHRARWTCQSTEKMFHGYWLRLPESYQKVTSGSRSIRIFQTGTTTNPYFSGSFRWAAETPRLSPRTSSVQSPWAPYTDDNTRTGPATSSCGFINSGPFGWVGDVLSRHQRDRNRRLSPQLSLAFPNASGYISIAAAEL